MGGGGAFNVKIDELKLGGLRGFGCLTVSLFALILGAPPTHTCGQRAIEDSLVLSKYEKALLR